ncbi:MAG: hypothetical protein ACXW1W_10850 [Methylococcaceae bacterium]
MQKFRFDLAISKRVITNPDNECLQSARKRQTLVSSDRQVNLDKLSFNASH